MDTKNDGLAKVALNSPILRLPALMSNFRGVYSHVQSFNRALLRLLSNHPDLFVAGSLEHNLLQRPLNESHHLSASDAEGKVAKSVVKTFVLLTCKSSKMYIILTLLVYNPKIEADLNICYHKKKERQPQTYGFLQKPW